MSDAELREALLQAARARQAKLKGTTAKLKRIALDALKAKVPLD